MTFPSRPVGLACAAVVALTLAACGSSHKKILPTTEPASTSVASSSSAAKPVVAATNPLTGGKVNHNGVIAVKIDDVAAALPQVNLDKADVVYVEQVEGGLTRLIAIFNTTFPTVVGPVRSVRANDPQILAQYGPIGFVASGGGGDSLTMLDASNLLADIDDRGGPGFSRDGNRPVPHNLFVDLAAVTRRGPAKSIGWTFDSSVADLIHTPVIRSISTVVGGTNVGFVWVPSVKGWVRTIGGQTQSTAAGVLERADNVIVQFCTGHTNYNDIDPAGNPGHYTVTVGSGRVVVFRNAHSITGTWSRATATDTTHLTSKGKPIALMPGVTWVILVENGAPLS